MDWYKKENYTDISKKIKSILKNHPFIKEIMNDYNLDMSEIDDHLKIIIKLLQGKFAEGNGKEIIIDPKILKDDFFKNNFHFVIHEFFHWVKRRFEQKNYFKDNEEIKSFVLAITWELITGKNDNDIYKAIYPLVEPHFEKKEMSKQVFDDMLKRSKDLYNIYLKKNTK
jgi:hypothetical protein